MPRIKEYSLSVGPAGPVETRQVTGEDFGAQSFRQVQNLGGAISQAGEVVQKRAEQSEISKLNSDMANLQAVTTNDLDQTMRTANPDDPDIAENFLSKYDEAAAKVGDSATTRAGKLYFAQNNAQLRSHFMESAARSQADLAGIRAKQNYIGGLNASSSALVNDPSSFSIALNRTNSTLESMVQSGALPAREAEQLRLESEQTLAKSSIRGWIRLNPEHAKKQLDSGQWDNSIGGDLKNQMYGEADQEIRGREAEKARLEADKKKIREQQQVETQNDFLNQMQKGTLSWQQVRDSNLDPFGSGSKEQFIRMLEDTSKNGATKTDPGTFNTLFQRINAPDEDPKKIRNENVLNEYLGRGLSFESLNQLRGEIQGKKTQAGDVESELKKGVADIAKGMLTRSNPMTGFRDPVGDEQYQKYMSFFLSEYKLQREKGKTPQELLDPSSPTYLGNDIRKFTRSPQQIIQDMVKGTSYRPVNDQNNPPSQTAPNPEKARKPGESAADYLKRTGNP